MAAVDKGATQELRIDCAAVHNMATAPNQIRCNHDKVHAGYWKRIHTVDKHQTNYGSPKWTKNTGTRHGANQS